MKLVTLEQLKASPKGTIFTRCNDNGNPSGGVYAWDETFVDNPYFGYAFHFVPSGHSGNSWECDDVFQSDSPSRFYYCVDFGEVRGYEAFFVYTAAELDWIAKVIKRSPNL